MLKLVKKTVVDSNNVLWQLEYDASDNTVEIVSEYATDGSAVSYTHLTLPTKA